MHTTHNTVAPVTADAEPRPAFAPLQTTPIGPSTDPHHPLTDREARRLVNEVRTWARQFDAPDAKAPIRACPGEGSQVPVWILGSSLYGAQLAAALGLPYAFASHFAPALPERAPWLARLRGLLEAMGARVDTMEADHHDLVLAVVSHTPHLIAYTMVGVADHVAQVSNSEVIEYSASGFRDFTRIAASDPTMWRDVFLTNKDATLDILGRFTEELFMLQRAIRMGDGDHLHAYFTRTRAIRRGIIEAGQDTAAPDFGRATLAVPKGG